MTRFFLHMLFAAFATLACATAASAQEIQALDGIRAAAESFARAQADPHAAEVRVDAGTLDPRLRLPACERPLEAFLPNGARSAGNVSIGVRCDGSKPWSVYVPVRVSVYRDVVVTARPVTRGRALTAADLRIERYDIGTLAYGYHTSVEQTVGMVAKRTLSPGNVVTPTAVESPRLVKRGEQVTVIAQAAGMEIRATGKALMDGTEGQRIRVKSVDSQRIVEGTVIASGVIEVNL